MITFRPLVVMAAVALLTTACSNEISMWWPYHSNLNDSFQYGASPGEMKAVVVGNPFPVSKPALDKIVVAAMQNNHTGPMTHFTTTPGPKAFSSYRIVVALNTPLAMSDYVLCGNPSAIPTNRKPGDRLHARVAFCVGSDLYSTVHISIPTVHSPADPRFSHMIASAMWQLLPTLNPQDSESNNLCTGTNCG